MNELTHSLEELSDLPMDALIIGSGPAGAAVAERLLSQHSELRIAILERGGVLTLTHLNNVFRNSKRRGFIDRFKVSPWEGGFKEGGMLIPALGGRGIASGAHLRRFDHFDFFWPGGEWPAAVLSELPAYYHRAEVSRRVNTTGIRGPAQTWAIGQLHAFGPHPPPVGFDLWSKGEFDASKGYDSGVAHLWNCLLSDRLRRDDPRFHICTQAYAVKLIESGGRVTAVECINASRNARRQRIRLQPTAVVLAASTIESARLMLLSGLEAERPAVGRFLAEHVERRAKIKVPYDSEPKAVSLVLSSEPKLQSRFQVHLRGEPGGDGSLTIDIGGFAAMDPRPENRVRLSNVQDEFGVPKAHVDFGLSEADKERTARLCQRIWQVAEELKGKFITEEFPMEGTRPRFVDTGKTIQSMDPGRSYHEAGTLRMGKSPETSVTDASGRVHGVSNLYVADASLFPCVGIANPMLTITALGYRVADGVVRDLVGSGALSHAPAGCEHHPGQSD